MMRSWRDKLVRFFYGRYGVDQFYYGLLVIYLILFLIHSFIHHWSLTILSSIVVLYAFFRALSKNISARRKENQYFLRLWNPVKTELKLCKDKIRDCKHSRYRRCKHCAAILKLPRKKGKHTVVCPKCGQRFSVRILW